MSSTYLKYFIIFCLSARSAKWTCSKFCRKNTAIKPEVTDNLCVIWCNKTYRQRTHYITRQRTAQEIQPPAHESTDCLTYRQLTRELPRRYSHPHVSQQIASHIDNTRHRISSAHVHADPQLESQATSLRTQRNTQRATHN